MNTTTKLSIKKINDKRSLASIHIVVDDGVIVEEGETKEIFDRVIKKNYKNEVRVSKGAPKTKTDLSTLIKPILIKRAKLAWEEFESTKDIPDDPVLVAINTSIKESFDTYINKEG